MQECSNIPQIQPKNYTYVFCNSATILFVEMNFSHTWVTVTNLASSGSLAKLKPSNVKPLNNFYNKHLLLY